MYAQWRASKGRAKVAQTSRKRRANIVQRIQYPGRPDRDMWQAGVHTRIEDNASFWARAKQLSARCADSRIKKGAHLPSRERRHFASGPAAALSTTRPCTPPAPRAQSLPSPLAEDQRPFAARALTPLGAGPTGRCQGLIVLDLEVVGPAVRAVDHRSMRMG
jgi:hypothetical protein